MFRRGISTAESDPHSPFLTEGQRDVKVNEPDIVLRGEHNIGRLDVPVEDSMGRPAVKIAQGLQQLAGPLHHLGLGKSLPTSQGFVQTLPLHIVHYRINHAVFFYKIINLRDICMGQIFHGVYFPAQHLWPGRQRTPVRL